MNVEDCWIFVFGENEKYITSQYFSGDALSETENEYVDAPAPNGGSQTYKKGYTNTLPGLDYGTYAIRMRLMMLIYLVYVWMH